MNIDKSKIRTQEELDEPAAIDKAGERVEAEMKLLEGKAKEQVAHGLRDENLAREAERLKKEAEDELKSVNEVASKKTES